MKKEEKPIGLLNGLWEFLKGIEELQNKGLEKSNQEEFSTPSGGRGIFDYNIKVGSLKKDNLSIRPLKGKGKTINLDNVEKESLMDSVEKDALIDVFDKGNHILIVVELPYIQEKDLNFKVIKNVLKINAKTSKGSIEKEIKIPKGSKVDKIEKVSMKNNILEIKLKKKKGGKTNGG